MIRSRLWLKTTLLILFIITLSALAIALYTIPLTRDITYQMAETHATALLDHVYDLVEVKHQEIESYKAFGLKTRKRELKAITATAGYIIKNEHAAVMAGKISQAQAKHRAIEQMRTIRYGNKDYMWISNFDSVLISHPDPHLHNADFSNVKDVYGNLIVPPMVEVARKDGEGFTSYWWNRLDMESPSEKLAYSTLFAPWSWVYGTGVYLDDIVQEVNCRKKELVDDLETLSSLDGLTGIPNRRLFDQTYATEWKRAQMNETPLSVIMMDIDYFKRFNDTYGHADRNTCLQQVAQALSSGAKRSMEFVARYGGEEFVAVLPGTDIKGGQIVAETMRDLVEKLKIPHLESEISDHVTISVGIASLTLPLDRDKKSQTLINAADNMLYKAKDKGRNRVCS